MSEFDDILNLPDSQNSKSPAAPSSSFDDIINLPDTPRSASKTESGLNQPPVRRPTTLQRARSAPAQPEPDLNLQQALQMAGKNFVPSAKGAGSAMLQSVLHPINTAQSLASLGRGAVSLTGKKLGFDQGPSNAQRDKDEALAGGLVDQYKQTYGSKQGFYRALANDPASIALDLSTPLTMGAGAAASGLKGASQAARIAGNLSRAGKLATAAKVASGVSAVTDPIGLAAKAVTYPITRGLIPVAGNLLSGSSMGSLIKAAEAGESSNPVIRKAFKDFSTGKSKASDVVDVLDRGFTDISNRRGTNYVQDMMKATNGNLPALDWNPVTSSIKNLRNNQNINYVDRSTGFRIPVNPEANAVIDQVENFVNQYSGQPAGAGSHTLLGFDALKKTIDNIRSSNRPGSVAYMAATDMRNAVKSAIQNQHPEYAKIMDDYATASEHMANIRSTLGVGSRSASDEKIIRNVLKAMKTGKGKDLVKSLSAENPTLAHNLAGVELNPVMPGGIRNVIMGGGLLYGATPAGIAHLAATSPRIAGAAQYAIGQGTRLAPTVAKGAYYAGRAGEESGLANQDQDVFDKMLQIESGNNQFKKDGSLVVSPVGAIGAAQIMPGTGPTAAALAGEEWSLERLKSDPEYNKKLGKAYYQSLVSQFGDPIYAAAAYNGGPERVKKAIEESKRSGRDWSEYLLPETQNYVRMLGYEPSASEKTAATGGRIQRASGGRAGQNHEQLVNRLMTMAKQAKKVTDKSTEPLLNAPDEAIVKALDVAQQAI